MKGEAADGVGGAAIDAWGCLEQTVANEKHLCLSLPYAPCRAAVAATRAAGVDAGGAKRVKETASRYRVDLILIHLAGRNQRDSKKDSLNQRAGHSHSSALFIHDIVLQTDIFSLGDAQNHVLFFVTWWCNM